MSQCYHTISVFRPDAGIRTRTAPPLAVRMPQDRVRAIRGAASSFGLNDALDLLEGRAASEKAERDIPITPVLRGATLGNAEILEDRDP